MISGTRTVYQDGELSAQLGEPFRIVTSLSGVDTLNVWRYFGIKIGLSRTRAGGRVRFLALTDARFVAPEGIRVGYAESEVLRLLGLPEYTEPARWVYPSEAGRLHVYFENSAVGRLEWHIGQGGR